MGEEIDLKQIERDIFRDYCRDGLFDMLLGAYLMSFGLYLLPQKVGACVAFMILPVLFYPPLMRGLKKRFVFPRTGYVKLRPGDPGPLPWFLLGSFVLGLVVLVVVLIVVGVIAQPAQWYRWMPISFGIWLAGIFLGLALRVRLLRYYVLAGLALVAGPSMALLPLAGKLANVGLFFVVVGAVVLALGAVTFIRFLRQYPPLAEEDHHGRE